MAVYSVKDNKGKSVIVEGISFVLGVFLLALTYNLFLLPNGFAFSGMSGMAIVIENLTGFSSTIFIYVSHITCLVISFLFLEWRKTRNTIVGSLLYPIMVTFTLPISNFLMEYFQFENMLITVLCTALLYGASNGLIYKYGYTTGGNDVLMQIVNKYLKVPESTGLFIVNAIVILGCIISFGVEVGVYSIIIMVISTIIIDKIMYGISNSKTFYIYSKKPSKLKKVILEEYESGYTILPTKGGYSHKDGYLIMVVVSNRDYYGFKNRILDIDPQAFFIIEDCYEVQGGIKRGNLPFM